VQARDVAAAARRARRDREALPLAKGDPHELISPETVITHGIDFDGDAVSVYASTIGYRIMDALRDAGLTIAAGGSAALEGVEGQVRIIANANAREPPHPRHLRLPQRRRPRPRLTR
jgi:hypothetical protein